MHPRIAPVLCLALPLLVFVPGCEDSSGTRGSSAEGGDSGWFGTGDGASESGGGEGSSSGADSTADSSTGADSGAGSSGGGDDPGGSSSGSSGGEDTTDGGPALEPPAGGSSGGSGGGAIDAELLETPSGVFYRMIAPGNAGPLPFLLVYSGTEGSQPMSINLSNFRGATGTQGFAIAVLHGVEYYGDTQAGIDVIDHVRSRYDIDNDRTYLMSESAGTLAGLELGLSVRQSYFAAYWANDVNTAAGPDRTAAELGFAPWGNSGPGGQFQLASSIVSSMQAAGYRTTDPAPYDGPGAGTHGDLDQLVAAIAWFPGKSRQ